MEFISNNPYLLIILILVCLLVGGGITIGGVRFEHPIGIWIKNRMGIKEDDEKDPEKDAEEDVEEGALERITGLESYHANTIVLAVKKGGKLTDAELLDVSSKANLFFGKRVETRELRGMKAGQLLPLLKAWMDEDKFEALALDQGRLFDEYLEEAEVHAKVPVIFNDKHPHYKNRAFLPVIVSLSREREIGNRGESEQSLQIVYLDLEPIVPVVKEYASMA